MALTFLIGGARSGKSRHAVELGRRHESNGGIVLFVATAPTFDDADWRERIERHRADRPGWPTTEAPTELTETVRALDDAALVIVDCLTLWVSNLMLRGDHADDILAAADRFAPVAAGRSGPTVVVSNEVGLGVHPDTDLGREFRDCLGAVNQRVAAAATTSLFFVAGRAIELVDPSELTR